MTNLYIKNKPGVQQKIFGAVFIFHLLRVYLSPTKFFLNRTLPSEPLPVWIGEKNQNTAIQTFILGTFGPFTPRRAGGGGDRIFLMLSLTLEKKV